MKKNKFSIQVLFLAMASFYFIILFINYNKKTAIDIKDNYTHSYGDYYNYYEDYNQGLLSSKDKDVNILLIFSAYSLPYNSFEHYLNTKEASYLIKDNVVIFLFNDDKAIYNGTTKGDFNKQLQRRFNSTKTPSFLILNNKEEIIMPPKEYVAYDEFIKSLKSAF